MRGMFSQFLQIKPHPGKQYYLVSAVAATGTDPLLNCRPPEDTIKGASDLSTP